jgi:hypothetical protein
MEATSGGENIVTSTGRAHGLLVGRFESFSYPRRNPPRPRMFSLEETKALEWLQGQNAYIGQDIFWDSPLAASSMASCSTKSLPTDIFTPSCTLFLRADFGCCDGVQDNTNCRRRATSLLIPGACGASPNLGCMERPFDESAVSHKGIQTGGNRRT